MSNSHHISKTDVVKKYCPEHILDEDQTRFIKWFYGEDGSDKDIIEARQQAVEAYPALAYEIIYKNKDICSSIEQKKSPTSALAKFYNIDEKNIKRLQGKTRVELGIEKNSNTTIVYFILHMKESHFQQFKNNLSDINILYTYTNRIYLFSLDEFLDYISLKGGKATQYIEKMKKNNVSDVKDICHFLCSKLFYPAFLNKAKDYAEKNNLFFSAFLTKLKYDDEENNLFFYTNNYCIIDRKSLIELTNVKTILDFSEHYHKNLFRWDDMFAFDSGLDHISWKPMFGEIDLGSGWSAREIHSIKELKEQRRRENNGIGGYTDSILERYDRSARLFFSLEKTGLVKSTIEILCIKNIDKDKLDIEVRQNRAHSNEYPDSETLNISTHLINKIKSEPVSRLNTYLHHRENATKEYRKYQIDNKYISECGYNPWDRDILNRIWDEFKPILPRRLQSLGLDGLIKIMPIDKDDFRPRNDDNELNPWEILENEKSNQINRDEGDIEIAL